MTGPKPDWRAAYLAAMQAKPADEDPAAGLARVNATAEAIRAHELRTKRDARTRALKAIWAALYAEAQKLPAGEARGCLLLASESVRNALVALERDGDGDPP